MIAKAGICSGLVVDGLRADHSRQIARDALGHPAE